MALVQNFKDGDNHLSSSILTTLDTLCGICDDFDNRPIGKPFEGKITCQACLDTARIVFESCKKNEVMK